MLGKIRICVPAVHRIRHPSFDAARDIDALQRPAKRLVMTQIRRA
jgi:hypothetical protein